MKNKNRVKSLLNFLSLAIANSFKLQTHYVRGIKLIFFSCIIGVLSWVYVPSAFSLTQIKLSDISYHECPAELSQGSVTSGGSTMNASCFIVTGKAENGTRKTVYDADIFGRIYDANNDSVMQNRTRLGSIPEVPPGISDFEMRITVPANQPTPLQLKQFKAAGFSAQVRK
jgi:hypothetical protein